ncbi:hypothetical protein SAMN06295933_0061 [Desulfovibrio gilichinskyi]|uniref:Uncharacterized protein n=1 Tax=Desulfovibrio gilichinskyi TaxID=1519643 RepID=A0A1X7C1J5_9BACT|nr:hypothetical protein SAMN06295933_0061 [Desulfovibrio gilichinskyi]
MVNNSDPLFNLIYAYTRKQAVEDSNLIDVTAQAKAKGRALQVESMSILITFFAFFIPFLIAV